VCCEYPNHTPRTSAVVLQCSHIPVALSPCYRFCFSALHTSQTPASVSPYHPVFQWLLHPVKITNNMPRTSAPTTSSSHCSNDSEHFPYRYVDLEHVMDTFSWWENVATAINLAHNNQTAFTEIAFLNYLFQNIRQKERQLEKDKQLARARIVRLLSKKSSDKLYQ
jgi:hypothetical protein